jgi:glutamyl-Q tRNA(Asp) synthetase
MIRTRFAPSPNGSLHLGHAYAAITAHDLARQAGGEFLLRIEDIDDTRSRAELVDEFLTDLTWLGIDWDGEVAYQSARLENYKAASERLKAMGLLYPCTCTRAEVLAAAVDSGPDGPIYPGICRGKPAAPDTNVAWRIDMAKANELAGPLWWKDQRAGRQRTQPALFGDAVLLRKEAPASYHLAATLDDAAQGITLVTRGRDLFHASHIHRLLQALLDLPVPQWHHHNLLVETDAKGQSRKLAKRRGSDSLAGLRQAGRSGPDLAAELREHRFPAGISLGTGLGELT